jgi:hypothetical protein
MTDVRDNTGLCAKCGTPADIGLIFCRSCGATLRATDPLVQSSDDYVRPIILSPIKRFVVTLLKVVAGGAAVIAILCPFGSWTQILIFVGSAVVALLCYSVLTSLDESSIEEYVNDGYWPAKPMDRSPRPDRKGTSGNDRDGRGT